MSPAARAPWPASVDGTLFGAPAPNRRPAGGDNVAADEEEAIAASAQAELADRFGEQGGLPERPARRRRLPFGPAPTRQVRRVFVAKFNPAAAAQGRFAVSDPLVVPQLWDPRAAPQRWVSDERARHRVAHDVIGAGDLIFVFRSTPTTTLVGVWWVVRVRRVRARGGRVATDVWHVPLVRFDDPVEVSVVRRRHPHLADIDAFTTARSALLEVAPEDAAALAWACSLPSAVLTDPDPVALARRLTRARTGARADDMAYARDARVRYRFIRAVERAAVERVTADLVGAGWVVLSRETVPGFGADLEATRSRAGRVAERRVVEVKGTSAAGWAHVVLQASQYREACAHAARGSTQWWLAVCLKVAPPHAQHLYQVPAAWVATHWPTHQVRRP